MVPALRGDSIESLTSSSARSVSCSITQTEDPIEIEAKRATVKVALAEETSAAAGGT